jgi:hypothetical protein
MGKVEERTPYVVVAFQVKTVFPSLNYAYYKSILLSIGM